MPWRLFWIANIGSALIWAPALLLLGSGLSAITRLTGAPKGWHVVVSIAFVLVVMAGLWVAHKYGWFDRVARYFGR
jgi:membrane protein DedA with SNARE-associated domain